MHELKTNFFKMPQITKAALADTNHLNGNPISPIKYALAA